MKKLQVGLLYVLFAALVSSCAIVRPGEVGVKQRLGRVKGEARGQGIYFMNFFTTKMLKVPTRTINIIIDNEYLPTKEGVSVECEFAVLFHINPESAVKIVETVGVRNGQGIILSALRSAASDVTAQFFAKDLYTAERQKISDAIAVKLSSILGDRGFVVEAVLLKTIKLPANLIKAIEEKLTAEQQVQAMQFVLERQKLEADRQRIEAEGIKNAQKILAEGLTDQIIKYKSLEVFLELSKSSNTKIIITDGKTPVLIQE